MKKAKQYIRDTEPNLAQYLECNMMLNQVSEVMEKFRVLPEDNEESLTEEDIIKRVKSEIVRNIAITIVNELEKKGLFSELKSKK